MLLPWTSCSDRLSAKKNCCIYSCSLFFCTTPIPGPGMEPAPQLQQQWILNCCTTREYPSCSLSIDFFSFFYGCTHCIWKLPGQGLNPSSGNARSLNPLCQAGELNPCLRISPSHCSWILNPQHHSRNSIFFFFFFLGLHLQHMEVPRLGVKLEPKVPVYTIATRDPSHICDLHHSSRQHQILIHWVRPGIKSVSSWILVRFVTRWATMGTPPIFNY